MDKRDHIPRGYPNLATIQRSIRALIPRVRSGALPSPPAGALWKGWMQYERRDPVISIQRLAREIARAYKLRLGTILVSLRSGLPVPGRVELGSGDDFLVEIDRNFAGRPRVLSAILAHEVAHIFLHRHRLRQPETLADEILTDTAAVLYGFGALMLDTYVVSETHLPVPGGTQIHRSERKLGYLTPDEYGYLLSHFDFSVPPGELESAAAQKALSFGQHRARRERASPPLASAEPIAAFRYRWHRSLSRLGWDTSHERHRYGYSLSAGSVTFRCMLCTQQIRVPTRKTLRVCCPTCGFAHHCVT